MPFKGKGQSGPLPASPAALFLDLSAVHPAQVMDSLTVQSVAAV